MKAIQPATPIPGSSIAFASRKAAFGILTSSWEKAIQYFQRKKGQVGKRAPAGFLEKHERPAIETEDSSFRAALYKVLLFFAVARSIKAGTLNARYSYRYRAIDEYLIPKGPWHTNWDQYIKQSGLTSFADGKKLLSDHG